MNRPKDLLKLTFLMCSQTFLAHLDSVAAQCGYTDYMSKHVTYPPKGLLPLPGKSIFGDKGCDVWDMIFDAALLVNPAFNVYRIFDTYPILWDVLGFPYVFHLRRGVSQSDIVLQRFFPPGTNSSLL